MPSKHSKKVRNAGSPPNYRHKIKNLFGSSIVSYLPLNDSVGTTTLADMSGNSRTAVLGGTTPPTLGVTGMGDNSTAVSVPAATAFINWYTASLKDAWAAVAAEGAFICWAKASSVDNWTAVTTHTLLYLFAGVGNLVRIYHPSGSAKFLLFTHQAGGTARSYYLGIESSYWFMFAFSWSVAGSYIRVYLNGIKQPVDGAAPGTWVGNLGNTETCLGAQNTASATPWSGSLAHAIILNRPVTDAEMLKAYTFIHGSKTISVLGDSISISSSAVYKYTHMLRDLYNSGKIMLRNHAVAGNTIVSNMDAQVVDAASDDADIIIIQLGTNDNNAGNMTTLQAEVEENLIELKTSNPDATIYYMNVLPRWTDVGGETETDKSNIRTAIAAACTAQGVTCWDTYTDPWIEAADTSDGMHPNDAGHVKIVTQILALLP